MASADNVIIFDFDGTLADVAEIIRSIYADMAAEKKWPKLTDKEYKRLRKGSIFQAARWVGIKPWQIPGLLNEGRKLFKLRSKEVILFSAITDVINSLHKNGFKIYVLSSNSEATIRQILKKNKVAEKVHILRRPSLFGKHKSISKLLAKENYSHENVWMVGDELRDIQAANKAGVNSIAVSWGLQDISFLKKADPTFVAETPQDIPDFLIPGGKDVR